MEEGTEVECSDSTPQLPPKQFTAKQLKKWKIYQKKLERKYPRSADERNAEEAAISTREGDGPSPMVDNKPSVKHSLTSNVQIKENVTGNDTPKNSTVSSSVKETTKPAAISGIKKFLELMNILNKHPEKCQKWLNGQEILKEKLGDRYKPPIIYATVKQIAQAQSGIASNTLGDKSGQVGKPIVQNSLDLLNILYLNPDKCVNWLKNQDVLKKKHGVEYQEPTIFSTVKQIALLHSSQSEEIKIKEQHFKTVESTTDVTPKLKAQSLGENKEQKSPVNNQNKVVSVKVQAWPVDSKISPDREPSRKQSEVCYILFPPSSLAMNNSFRRHLFRQQGISRIMGNQYRIPRYNKQNKKVSLLSTDPKYTFVRIPPSDSVNGVLIPYPEHLSEIEGLKWIERQLTLLKRLGNKYKLPKREDVSAAPPSNAESDKEMIIASPTVTNESSQFNPIPLPWSIPMCYPVPSLFDSDIGNFTSPLGSSYQFSTFGGAPQYRLDHHSQYQIGMQFDNGPYSSSVPLSWISPEYDNLTNTAMMPATITNVPSIETQHTVTMSTHSYNTALVMETVSTTSMVNTTPATSAPDAKVEVAKLLKTDATPYVPKIDENILTKACFTNLKNALKKNKKENEFFLSDETFQSSVAFHFKGNPVPFPPFMDKDEVRRSWVSRQLGIYEKRGKRYLPPMYDSKGKFIAPEKRQKEATKKVLQNPAASIPLPDERRTEMDSKSNYKTAAVSKLPGTSYNRNALTSRTLTFDKWGMRVNTSVYYSEQKQAEEKSRHRESDKIKIQSKTEEIKIRSKTATKKVNNPSKRPPIKIDEVFSRPLKIPEEVAKALKKIQVKLKVNEKVDKDDSRKNKTDRDDSSKDKIDRDDSRKDKTDRDDSQEDVSDKNYSKKKKRITPDSSINSRIGSIRLAHIESLKADVTRDKASKWFMESHNTPSAGQLPSAPFHTSKLVAYPAPPVFPAYSGKPLFPTGAPARSASPGTPPGSPPRRAPAMVAARHTASAAPPAPVPRPSPAAPPAPVPQPVPAPAPLQPIDPIYAGLEPDRLQGTKRSAFDRLGPVVAEAKKPKLTINLLFKDEKTEVVREVVEEHVPVFLRYDVLSSEDVIVKAYLKMWPWTRHVKTTHEASHLSNDLLLDEFEMVDCYKSKSAWVKIAVTGYDPHLKKEDVLDALLNYLNRMEFIPCFVEFKQDECKFLVNRSENALTYLHKKGLVCEKDGIKLNLVFSQTDLSLENLKFYKGAVFKAKLKKAFNDMTNTLNLTAFQMQPDNSHFMYFPLNNAYNQGFIMNAVRAVLTWNNITTVNLSDNRLTFIDSFNFVENCPSLRHLDLSDNRLPTASTLACMKGMRLHSIRLEGNPLCGNFIQQEHYIDVVKLLFPRLQYLDGIAVDSDIEIKRNFSVAPCGQDFLNSFLEIYFTLIDSNDRTLMVSLYSEDAVFSITCSPAMKRKSMYRNMKEFYMWCRCLQDTSAQDPLEGAIVGGAKIVKYFTKWPIVMHDPYTFTVDVILHTEMTTVIKVTGLFKIPAESLTQEEPIAEFSRTFVLSTEDGMEYKITNELMYISEASEKRMQSAFQFVGQQHLKSIDFDNMKFDGPPDDILKEQLTEVYMNLTEMDRTTSERCLDLKDWNLKKALEYFIRIGSAAKLDF